MGLGRVRVRVRASVRVMVWVWVRVMLRVGFGFRVSSGIVSNQPFSYALSSPKGSTWSGWGLT